MLSTLERYHVPATFFEVGIHVGHYPQYTRQLAAAGYGVQDHTWTHPDLTTVPVSQYPYQIDQTQSEIRSLTGRTPSCVKPPYQRLEREVLSQLSQRGLTTMSYSVGPKDWSLPGTQTIVSRVISAAFPGAVVDLHDAGGTARSSRRARRDHHRPAGTRLHLRRNMRRPLAGAGRERVLRLLLVARDHAGCSFQPRVRRRHG